MTLSELHGPAQREPRREPISEIMGMVGPLSLTAPIIRVFCGKGNGFGVRQTDPGP